MHCPPPVPGLASDPDPSARLDGPRPGPRQLPVPRLHIQLPLATSATHLIHTPRLPGVLRQALEPARAPGVQFSLGVDTVVNDMPQLDRRRWTRRRRWVGFRSGAPQVTVTAGDELGVVVAKVLRRPRPLAGLSVSFGGGRGPR